MPTSEPELTLPVSLCLPNGQSLNPLAKGFSRTPLHTANLTGSWGRTKKWDYWCLLSPQLVIAITYADVDYLGFASIAWIDLQTKETGGYEPVLPFARGVLLPDKPGSAPLIYEYGEHKLEISDDETGTQFKATWVEKDGRKGKLEMRVELPQGHESLNVVIPWSEHLFQYTSKHQARPAKGRLEVGSKIYEFGLPASTEQVGNNMTAAWGVLDVGRGRWPYSTNWNWGGGAGYAQDGKTVVGIQVGGKWTQGTGFTENGIIVDGRLNKIGEELIWEYEWENPMKPWRVRDRDGKVMDITLTPTFDRHSATNVIVLSMEVHQMFGTWTGWVTAEDGRRIEVEEILGFAEESRSRW